MREGPLRDRQGDRGLAAAAEAVQDIRGAWAGRVVCDEGGGYRRFLGSDPLTGRALSELCDERLVMNDSFVMSDDIANLASSLEQIILPDPSLPEPEAAGGEAVKVIASRFYPELLDAVVAETKSLIEGGVPPADIVVISNAYGKANVDTQCVENGVSARSGVRVFGAAGGKWVRTRRVWNQHAYHVTNVIDLA